MKNRRHLLIIVAIMVFTILFGYVLISGSFEKGKTTTETPSVNSTPALNKTSFYLKFFPAEIQSEVQTLSGEYSLDIMDWGFDPITTEIIFYNHGIRNESLLKKLRGKNRKLPCSSHK